MNDLAIPANQDGGDDFIAGIQHDFAVFGQVFHQVIDIVGEHPGGAGGQHTGDILNALEGDAVFHFDGAGRGDLAVAALVDGNVYDDGAGLFYENACDRTIGTGKGVD